MAVWLRQSITLPDVFCVALNSEIANCIAINFLTVQTSLYMYFPSTCCSMHGSVKFLVNHTRYIYYIILYI
jgi:hypothetical protein